MANPIKTNKENREIILNKMTATMKAVFAKGKSVSKEKLINYICSETLISRRTATDYLKIVSARITYKEVKVDGETCLIAGESGKEDKLLQRSLK